MMFDRQQSCKVTLQGQQLCSGSIGWVAAGRMCPRAAVAGVPACVLGSKF